MSNVKTGGQALVELATLGAIVIGATSAAQKYSRAQVALQVAGAFQSVSTGDIAGGLASAQAALLSKVTDPGEVAVVNSLFAIGGPQLIVVAQADAAVPLLSDTVEGAATDIANGITYVASQYKAPSSSSKPQASAPAAATKSAPGVSLQA